MSVPYKYLHDTTKRMWNRYENNICTYCNAKYFPFIHQFMINIKDWVSHDYFPP